MKQRSFEEVRSLLKGKVILVANRGIPARRISRSINERFSAIAAVTATDIDKTMPAASSAQELLLLGSDPRAYLDVDRIIELAKRRGCVAIHPGWGFASEDMSFPKKAAEAGLVFIGADADAMYKLGNKVQSRKVAKSVGIPVIPGSDDAVTIEEAREVIARIGLPVMLKAEGGGGGKGIFCIRTAEELEDAFMKASAMAQASFGNPRLFVEKYLENVHHIEIQVIADRWGNVFAFDERDCTIQRSNQKLLEVTPSPWKGITPALRAVMKDYAKALVRNVGYHSLATVEFLVTADGKPYMIEVNTRLQVEHGITESRYGIDLVEESIAIAFGSELRFNEEVTRPVFKAMQVRINLENPRDNFTPNSGLITRYVSPGGPGVRLDSNLSAGYEFPSNYDSAGALLITYASDWQKTLGIMERALKEYEIGGPKTTIPFMRRIITNEDFRSGNVTTTYLAEHPEVLSYQDLAPESERLARLVAEISAKGFNPYVQLGAYRSPSTPRLGSFEPLLPQISEEQLNAPGIYPKGNRRDILESLRDGYVHFTDTTTRDQTQSNHGNRLRLAEDRLIGPYLDNAGLFSIENGGGAHFHVAMLANGTYPFTEAREWNQFAPKTLKQLLVRSTNVLGYVPQPKNLMRITGEMICDHYDVVRCFDFLNEPQNMRPIAEVVMSRHDKIFEPALSLSWAPGFTVSHYVQNAETIIDMLAKLTGLDQKKVVRRFILGLKDMAGVCPPEMMKALVKELKKRWPELVLHYHRHTTDGLFVPACAAAAGAGCEIIDAALGSSVRSYGQGDIVSLARYIESEYGIANHLNRDMLAKANFVTKQIMPYLDRYCSPYFNGTDYEVTRYAMPGGATSSSQEGAVKQGYIQLLPHMLEFLECTRRIVRYHDVTPGSQITWNTAFLAVTGAYKRSGLSGVETLLAIARRVSTVEESKLTEQEKAARLILYVDCNEAFRNLLLGKFGRLPLGFPADWVYESAFGEDWTSKLEQRTTDSPLLSLKDVDLEAERAQLEKLIGRASSDEEFVMYLNHPADAIKTIDFQTKFGNPNNIPIDVWFAGIRPGQTLNFNNSVGKPHQMQLLSIDSPNEDGISTVRYVLDSEILTTDVTVKAGSGKKARDVLIADPSNIWQVASPRRADLWIVYVNEGEIVKKGQELFNVSIMKQEKAILAPCDGIVRRVYKTADFKKLRQMTPVMEGELIIELGPIPALCQHCKAALPSNSTRYCPQCGTKV